MCFECFGKVGVGMCAFSAVEMDFVEVSCFMEEFRGSVEFGLGIRMRFTVFVRVWGWVVWGCGAYPCLTS